MNESMLAQPDTNVDQYQIVQQLPLTEANLNTLLYKVLIGIVQNKQGNGTFDYIHDGSFPRIVRVQPQTEEGLQSSTELLIGSEMDRNQNFNLAWVVKDEQRFLKVVVGSEEFIIPESEVANLRFDM